VVAYLLQLVKKLLILKQHWSPVSDRHGEVVVHSRVASIVGKPGRVVVDTWQPHLQRRAYH
jgi:hypothetical protein